MTAEINRLKGKLHEMEEDLEKMEKDFNEQLPPI